MSTFTVYIHDVKSEMLYALPKEPTITPRKNRNDVVKTWMAGVDIQISTPHNEFRKKRWLIPLEKRIEQEYPRNRKEKDIVSAFQKKFYPKGERIGYQKYIELKERYDEQSGVNW